MGINQNNSKWTLIKCGYIIIIINRCSNCFCRRWTYTRVVSSLSESISAVCTDNEIDRDRRLTWVCPQTPVNSTTRWNPTQHIMKNRHLNYTNQFHWTHTLHSHLISRSCFSNVYVPHVGLHTTGSKEEEEKSVMEKAVSSLKERKQEKVRITSICIYMYLLYLFIYSYHLFIYSYHLFIYSYLLFIRLLNIQWIQSHKNLKMQQK